MTKAVVLGASGGIGQPLSLLLKTNPVLSELYLYDVVNTPGVAKDLSHIDSPAQVKGFLKSKPEVPVDEGLKETLTGADIVVIPAGIPRKPGMTRDDLFKINAGIVAQLVQGIADFSPDAFVLIISNPVNSTVPIAAEVLKKNGKYNPKKLFGVTTLDVVRASTFVSEKLGDPSAAPHVSVPVVGGHSGETIVPLISQSSQKLAPSTPLDVFEELTNRIQFGGDEVVQAKEGMGSATLSMAYAGAEFAVKIIRAIKGEAGIIAPTYVDLTSDPEGGKALQAELKANQEKVGKPYTDISFFSTRVQISANGVEKILPLNELGPLSELEEKLLGVAVPKGASFVQDVWKAEVRGEAAKTPAAL